MDGLRNLTGLAIPLLLLVCVGNADAQHKPLKEQVVGVWSLVSGSQVGADANGLLILDGSGHMSMQIIRPGRPKFASNSRMQGSADENKGAVHGMISYFGRYTVSEADKTITYQIERSSYPNWDGTEQKRPFTVTADELRYTNPAPSSGGAPAQLIWKRAK
jgi:hypothetical protein